MRQVRTDYRQLLLVSGLALVTAALAVVPLWRLTGTSSDIIPHAELAVKFVESGNVFTYSLYYPLIWLATAGGDPATFRVASVALLSFFVVLKVIVAYLIAQDIHRQPWSSALIAFGITFFGPLVNPAAPHDIYLGQITATVWHNSTNIMVAPFALIAFWAAMRLVRDPSGRTAIIAGIACTVAILVKPNFAMAMIPVVGIVVLVHLIRRRVALRRSLGILAAAALPPLVTLVVQYAIIYGGGLARDEQLTVAPFAVWNVFSDNLPLSLLLSLIGVAVALGVLLLLRQHTPELVWAWCILGVTIAQFILLAERTSSGGIEPSGNWFWGSYTALMVVALMSATGLRGSVLTSDSPTRRLVPMAALAVLALHVAAGVYYALVVGTAAYGAY